MKLSFLGMKKLMAWASNDIKGDLKDLEFEQKDFKGSVLLTVEEAKAICDYARDFYVHQSRVSDDFEQLHSDIKERIEQVEMSKQST